ncbi:hypothetical protein OIE68_00540 [Nocardia vinacea]|uniref:hypothetical protein n=1 Tax=Nocardia vinacea TaxID=96468 RepID=UPI002E0DBE6F|nr:hypothetical protein OIE68_00540 [Nocardia vinacea]
MELTGVVVIESYNRTRLVRKTLPDLTPANADKRESSVAMTPESHEGMMERAAALASSFFPAGNESTLRQYSEAWIDIGERLEAMARIHENIYHQYSARNSSGRTDRSIAQLHIRLFADLHHHVLYCYGMAAHLDKISDLIELGKLEITAIASALIADLDSDMSTLPAGQITNSKPDLAIAEQAMRRIARRTQQQVDELPPPTVGTLEKM